MNFFEIIMSPFIYIIKQVFLLSYQLTGDYGTAIVLLSFVISLLLLPIFIFIEKAKKKDDAIKLKMKPLIDEIKRVYKGQERFYYIKTINRQHNYSSGRALIPILSLLLQIPFFIAAYQFLENFEPLKGISFLFVKDLSLPDGLFGAIHFLPIFMTFVNLLTAYFYTRNGNTSERKQMIIVAGVFLILLFNLPSGLVLYWTMNNVFSFFRLFITNKEVFKKKKRSINFAGYISKFKHQLPLLKKVFIVILLVLIALQLNWAFRNNFDDIYLRITGSIIISIFFTLLIGIIFTYKKQYKTFLNKITIKPQIFYSLLFLTVYFYFASKFYYSGENIYLNIFAILFLIPTQFFGYIYTKRSVLKINKNIYKSLIILLKMFFIFQILLLSTFILRNDISFEIVQINILINTASISDIIAPGIIFSFTTLFSFAIVNKVNFINYHRNHWVILVLSVFYLTGFIFLWNPLTIYSTFPETFEFPAVDILRSNFVLFLKASVLLIILYLILPKKLKSIWLILILTLTVVSFIHNSVLPIDVGTLQENKFTKQDNLAVTPLLLLFESLIFTALFFLFHKLLKRRLIKHIIIGLFILNIVLISQSFYESINTGSFYKKELISTDIPNSISFSKDKENVVYLISDMFHGYSMDSIIKEIPEIKNQLSGFTWYPNTLSVSTITSTSISAMLGGFEYTPDKMNMNKEQTIREKITYVTEEFRDKIQSKGYHFTSTPMIYSTIDKNSYDTYLPKWHEDWDKWNQKLNIGYSKELGFTILWENAAFYCAPLFVKSVIYNSGKWFHGDVETNDNTNQAKPYNFLRLLPFISNIKNKKPSFIYIHSMASHHPWDIIDDEGIMHSDISPYDNNKWVIQTLIKWIEWMKANNVYDNTKIIFVSDHGPHWGFYKGDVKIKVPLIKNPELKAWEGLILSMNALLLVKDFKSNNPMQIDWRFLSNADCPAIVFDENDPTKLEPPEERVLTTCYPKWITKIGEKKQFITNSEYSVKNNYFNLLNWKAIKENYE